MDGLPDFTTFAFKHADRERTVYRKGEGPAVLVMHEVPGISTEVARFARRLVEAGFTVFMPHQAILAIGCPPLPRPVLVGRAGSVEPVTGVLTFADAAPRRCCAWAALTPRSSRWKTGPGRGVAPPVSGRGG